MDPDPSLSSICVWAVDGGTSFMCASMSIGAGLAVTSALFILTALVALWGLVCETSVVAPMWFSLTTLPLFAGGFVCGNGWEGFGVVSIEAVGACGAGGATTGNGASVGRLMMDVASPARTERTL